MMVTNRISAGEFQAGVFSVKMLELSLVNKHTIKTFVTDSLSTKTECCKVDKQQ